MFLSIHWTDVNVVTYLINGISLNIKQNSPTLINSLVLLLYSVKQFFQTFVYPLVIRIISPDCTCFPNSSHLQLKDYCVNVYDETRPLHTRITPRALSMVKLNLQRKIDGGRTISNFNSSHFVAFFSLCSSIDIKNDEHQRYVFLKYWKIDSVKKVAMLLKFHRCCTFVQLT